MSQPLQSLITPDKLITISPVGSGKKRDGSSRKQFDPARRGCDNCPANRVRGIRKIRGHVLGRKLFIWAQSPGPKENVVGRELVGPTGEWFWERLESVTGLTRADCDIQNVVRCFPASWENGRLRMRDPTKEERFCCSLYTDRALLKSKARVHIVLGRIAAKELLGGEFSARNKIFWSEKLRAHVVVLDHPAYFLYGAPASRLREFDIGLRAAAAYLRHAGRSKFSILSDQDYGAVRDARGALALKKEMTALAYRGETVVVDIEDATVNGKRVPLMLGFCAQKGRARSLILSHPDARIAEADRKVIWQVARDLISDARIQKAAHHGSYDVSRSEELFGVPFRGYDWDTNYSEYIAFPGFKSYKLSEVAIRRFPEFSGYKEIVMPHAAPAGMSYEDAYEAGKLDLSKVPLKNLVLYNCADCDVTFRAMKTVRHKVYHPLLRVYMDAAFIIDMMRDYGPYLDYTHRDLIDKLYPRRAEILKKKLQIIANDPEFNPGAPEQVAKLLYETLKIPPIESQHGGKVNTRKETLETLALKHKEPRMVLDYRSNSKIKSTYSAGFARSADAHHGRVTTIWWLTGTTTGRLRSGGSGLHHRDSTVVNLQNIHGAKTVKNLLVSDTRWRGIFRAWQRIALSVGAAE